ERAVAAQVVHAAVRARDDRVAESEAEERVDLLVLEVEMIVRRRADRDVRPLRARRRPRVEVRAGLNADDAVAEVRHAAERVLGPQAEGDARGADPAQSDRRPDVRVAEAEPLLRHRRLRERGEDGEHCCRANESRHRSRLLSRGMVIRRHQPGTSPGTPVRHGQRAVKPGTGPFPWMSDVPWPSSPNWLEPQANSAPSGPIASVCPSPADTNCQPAPSVWPNS